MTCLAKSKTEAYDDSVLEMLFVDRQVSQMNSYGSPHLKQKENRFLLRQLRDFVSLAENSSEDSKEKASVSYQ